MSWHARGYLAVFLIALASSSCASPRPGIETEPEARPVPTGKLPDGARPVSYRLSLEVIPERDHFIGSAMITLELDRPSTELWMHGERLEVTAVHATHATIRIEGAWTQHTSDGVSRVTFREPLPAGRSTLHVEYRAPFDTPLRGLYRVESGGETYAFTQFESISARLAFPCFDEPRFKTPFELSLTVPAEHFAASNTPVDRSIDLPGGLKRVNFSQTPPLPTYLVAFVVGPFDVVDGATVPPSEVRPFPIPVRGLAAKGKGPLLKHALDHTAPFVEALERYFDIRYPYRKLDLVAVPDFAAGAMENVGLITFREWFLLLDPERATEGQRRAFAYVMAHELAHQWFGNLVTMPWWDDIWLNESFATWMGNKVVHGLHPEYRSDLASLAYVHRAMGLDSLTHARQIRQPVSSNHDIKNAFDMITYQKGGAVLSMFEHWMGADRFQAGIRTYLQRHREGTATSGDLLAALDEATPTDVTSPFTTFLTQPGVPLVTVQSAECESGSRRLRLDQARYLPVGSEGQPEQHWEIPLCVRHELGRTCGLLEDRRGHLDLPGCPSWWMPNEEGAGYFRFAMTPSDWTRLRDEGFRQLSAAGRIAVADSLYASFTNGSLDASALIPWFAKFVRSPLRQVALGPMGPLRFMMNEAASPDVRPQVRAYGARLYRARYRQLGWRSKEQESSDATLLREAVIRFMVMDVRDPGARERAARLGRALVGFPDGDPNPDAVEPQLASLVLAAAVQESPSELFEELVAQLRTSTDPILRNRILGALGHAERADLSERALQLTLDPALRRNEVSRILGTQFRNVRTRERAWDWLVQNFDALAARTSDGQTGNVPWYAASRCSEEAAEEARELFEPRIDSFPGGPRNLASAIEAIELCVAKVEAQQPGVDRAFSVKRP